MFFDVLMETFSSLVSPRKVEDVHEFAFATSKVKNGIWDPRAAGEKSVIVSAWRSKELEILQAED